MHPPHGSSSRTTCSAGQAGCARRIDDAVVLLSFAAAASRCPRIVHCRQFLVLRTSPASNFLSVEWLGCVRCQCMWHIHLSPTSMRCRAAFRVGAPGISRDVSQRGWSAYVRHRSRWKTGSLVDCSWMVCSVSGGRDVGRVGLRAYSAGVGIKTRGRSRHTGAGAGACPRHGRFLPNEEECVARSDRADAREAEAGPHRAVPASRARGCAGWAEHRSMH
ncbi:hypothetical protein B0H19DRAFT_1104213 [Mycena capillaripes]|nr:hypothetical protein B0H19DRAFT_1104213 [Mycena capillaripes]